LQPADSDRRERGEIEHSPEAVAAWAAMLSARFGGQPVALAVEQSRGPLVFMLGKYEQLHIYPIRPRAAAQFRAALFPSGAKDDPSDAELLLDLLVHHAPACAVCSRIPNRPAWYSISSKDVASW
jgi:hypothetical protein